LEQAANQLLDYSLDLVLGNEVANQQPERPRPGGAEPNPPAGARAGEVLGGGGAEPRGVVQRPEGGAGPVLPVIGIHLTAPLGSLVRGQPPPLHLYGTDLQVVRTAGLEPAPGIPEQILS
jgi:hypothetical protein